MKVRTYKNLKDLIEVIDEFQANRAKESTHVDIPCRSDRAWMRVGGKTSADSLSLREVALIMRNLTPATGKRPRSVRVIA